MSRVGKNPILLPEKVKVSVQNGQVLVEGPMGKLTLGLIAGLQVETDSKHAWVKRENEERGTRAKHGLTRALIANMVKGVSDGFKRELEINGVGYRAEVKGSDLHLAVGFSHPVVFPIPQGVKVSVEKQTRVSLVGADCHLVGQVVSEIRNIRPPEPYKGKGIKYAEEVIRRKAGKSAAGAGAKSGK